MQSPPSGKTGHHLRFISYAQITGIILVVAGHSFHEYPTSNCYSDLLVLRMIYSFHMPLFVFLSGFLTGYQQLVKGDAAPSAPVFLRQKALRLLLPFATLTLVTFVPRAIMSGMADDSIALDLTSFCRAFLFSNSLVIPYFWFLQALFVLLVTSYGFIRALRHSGLPDSWTYLLLAGILAALPYITDLRPDFFSLGRAIRMGFFFAAGAIYGRYNREADRLIPWTHPAFPVVLALVWSGLLMAAQPHLYAVCALAGVCMTISVAKILDMHKIRILDHLTGSNYMIFLLSWYFNVASQQLLAHFVSMPWWVYTMLSITSGIYGPWLLFRWIQRHPRSVPLRAIAFLLGQKRA